MRPFYILYMWGQSCQLLQIQKQKRGRFTEQWKYTILRIQHVLIYSVPGQVAREMIHKVLLNRGRLAIVLNTPKHDLFEFGQLQVLLCDHLQYPHISSNCSGDKWCIWECRNSLVHFEDATSNWRMPPIL